MDPVNRTVLIILDVAFITYITCRRPHMLPNGPAIWRAERQVPTYYVGIASSQNAAMAVTRRSIRAESWYFSQKAVTSLTLTERSERHGVQGEHGACFCSQVTELCGLYACRGTSMIGATRLSPVTNLVADTGAVSRRRP